MWFLSSCQRDWILIKVSYSGTFFLMVFFPSALGLVVPLLM